MAGSDWSEAFTPRGVDQSVMQAGTGAVESFLARGAWAAAGGLAAEMVHDYAVDNKDDFSMLDNIAEETVGLALVVLAAYAVEKWLWKGPGAKIFTAGMAGRYGADFFDMAKAFVKGKDKPKTSAPTKKAQGLDEDESMDGSRATARKVGRVLCNSPEALDKLADVMAAQMSTADPEEFKDRKAMRNKFRQHLDTIAGELAS